MNTEGLDHNAPDRAREELYAPFAMRLSGETEEKRIENLRVLREALALKIEEDASTPGYDSAFSERYYRSVERLREGGKIPCMDHRGFVSAVGQEFSLSKEDKALFWKEICGDDFLTKVSKQWEQEG